MAFKLPRLDRSFPLVEDNKSSSFSFQSFWNQAMNAIETAIVGIQDALDAAGIALDAAAVAEAAAVAAQDAADDAQAAANGAGTTSKLSGSGVTGLTLQGVDAGTDASVTISNHTRVYSDGSSVSVTGDTLTGLGYSTTYYVYYDDPTFAGGAVTYVATTTQADAAQVSGRHLVGQVLTPAALDPPNDGLKPTIPGFGQLE